MVTQLNPIVGSCLINWCALTTRPTKFPIQISTDTRLNNGSCRYSFLIFSGMPLNSIHHHRIPFLRRSSIRTPIWLANILFCFLWTNQLPSFLFWIGWLVEKAQSDWSSTKKCKKDDSRILFDRIRRETICFSSFFHFLLQNWTTFFILLDNNSHAWGYLWIRERTLQEGRSIF